MNGKFCGMQLVIATVMLLFQGITLSKGIDWGTINPEISTAAFVNDSSECFECHERYMRTRAMTRHGRTLPRGGCESCHGPMSMHLDAPRRIPALVVSLGAGNRLNAAQKVAVCIQCHTGGRQMNWQAGAHALADNTCFDCHDLTSMEDPVLTRFSQAGICFTCHKDIRARMYRRSRHPLREGKVVCSDCHNPHGSAGLSQLVRNTVNETCYQCHAEKRGPFLVEHQPSREDCTICHDPHGSTQPRMLKLRQPYLCQQCHAEAFHPATLYEASGLPINGGSESRLLGRSCTNCHAMIHGSNHPSGQRLSR